VSPAVITAPSGVLASESTGCWQTMLPLSEAAAELAAFVELTRAHVAAPLVLGGRALGLLAIGDRLTGQPYGSEELLLISAIAQQSAASVLTARLAQEVMRTREAELSQLYATFLVHDLKNLGTTLSLVAQNAAKHGDDPEFRAEAMKTVTRTAEQMGELITQLSRRSPGHGRVAAVDMGELVSETVRSLGPGFGAELVPVAGRLGQVLAAPEQLQQVVLNLLLNAKKAAGASGHGEAPLVRLSLAVTESGVRLEVADEGPGIPPERLKTLFEDYATTKRKGIGLGLAICKKLTDEHHGRIQVESDLGAGTTFLLCFPFSG